MSKTIRIKYPQWQGGINPNYVFGAELLSVIAPQNPNDETVEITVDRDLHNIKSNSHGIDCEKSLLKQKKYTENILLEKQPDKVIVFGGDCSVTQVPFDYLKGKYGEEIGILWLDAHPDISTINHTSHLHEMVLGNLIGLSQDIEVANVNNPYKTNKVLLAGLIEEDLRKMDLACKELNICIATPETLRQDKKFLSKWMKENEIKYLAVHWDLDVLSPIDFRSIYPAEPHTNFSEFGAAIGKMTLKEIGTLLNSISNESDIVGLSITEHLPWDAFNLRKALESISIFQK